MSFIYSLDGTAGLFCKRRPLNVSNSIQLRHPSVKREDPSSKPPDTKIYFESKPISSFENLLEEGEHDHDHDDDESSNFKSQETIGIMIAIYRPG